MDSLLSQKITARIHPLNQNRRILIRCYWPCAFIAASIYGFSAFAENNSKNPADVSKTDRCKSVGAGPANLLLQVFMDSLHSQRIIARIHPKYQNQADVNPMVQPRAFIACSIFGFSAFAENNSKNPPEVSKPGRCKSDGPAPSLYC